MLLFHLLLFPKIVLKKEELHLLYILCDYILVFFLFQFFLLKVFFLVFIPSILTFLEPDTGAVIFYLIIMITMLFLSNIKKTWLLSFIFTFSLLIGTILYLYYFKDDLFIKIFGSHLFYRLDRLFDWTTSSGMQLENSVIAIASSGIIGNGINNILIYFPEGHTDFIFASYSSIYGLIGIAILFITIVYFDIKILNITKNKKSIYKYIIICFLIVILFGQLQNICMTVGISPIMGITLPFISYGGSSLISYMIILGIILAINNEK